jgi:predicted polyphosphate/ATP-dependent NAD kinase
VSPVDVPLSSTQRDSTLAAAALAAAGVGCIITLGGDGTNRAVAKAGCDVPLVPISTGTNNVFPSVIEGTLAGLAAGLVAVRPDRFGRAIWRSKRLDVLMDGALVDLALIDVAVSAESYVGSRAVWDAKNVRELVLAVAEPGSIGLSAIGAHRSPVGRREAAGLHLRLGPADDSPEAVLAPIAPGLLANVGVASGRRLAPGETANLLVGHGTIALDGEREIVLTPAHRASVRLSLDGPKVVDVSEALAVAAAEGIFRYDRNR